MQDVPVFVWNVELRSLATSFFSSWLYDPPTRRHDAANLAMAHLA